MILKHSVQITILLTHIPYLLTYAINTNTMKQIITISLLACLYLPTGAQTWGQLAITLTGQAASGAAYGVRETVSFHNAAFFRVHPRASRRYWGPDMWENKYVKLADGSLKQPLEPVAWGSTTWRAWYYDGYHLMGTASNACRTFSDGYSDYVSYKQGTGTQRGWWATLGGPKEKPIWAYLCESAAKSAAWSMGFHITYTHIYHP
jgi:hypothetical protein